MKKLCVLFLILFSLLNVAWTKKPPKCNQPIYFFEETSKVKLFMVLDDFLQDKKIIPIKYYPELGFISINYKFNFEKPEIVTFDLKQYGNDAYLFFDISKGNSDFEAEIYNELKKYSKNSYLLRDDMFCKEFKKDIKAINKNKKVHLKDRQYSPSVYVFDMNRYIGYKKKQYFKKRKVKIKNEKI